MTSTRLEKTPIGIAWQGGNRQRLSRWMRSGSSCRARQRLCTIGSNRYMPIASLVIVEGDIGATGKKIEVWRAAVGTPGLATERTDILAVISDDQPPVTVPVWPRGDVAELADRLLACDLREQCGRVQPAGTRSLYYKVRSVVRRSTRRPRSGRPS